MASQTVNPQHGRFGFPHEAQERISSDKFALIVFIFSVFSLLTQSTFILINWGKLPPAIPIFYSRPWGELMLGSPAFLWILPIVTVAFVLTNYFIALFLIQSQYFLNRVLIVFSAIIAFATVYDTVRIIGLLV